MDKQTIQFIGKTYIGGKSDRPIIRNIAKAILCLYGVIVIVIIAIEGFSFDIIKSNIIPVLLMLYVINQTKSICGYKNSVINIEFDSNEIVIIYDGIDKNDKMGPRLEKIRIEYQNITRIEYSNPLKCLNIQGYPIESIKYLKQASDKEFINNCVELNKEKRTLLYISSEEKEIVINKLQEKTNINIVILD